MAEINRIIIYKAVIFDLDGLLINSDDLIFKATRKVLRKKFSINIDKNNFSKVFGLKANEFSQGMVDNYNLPINQKEFLEILIKEIPYKQVKLKNGAIKLLAFLEKQKIKLILATNSSKKDLFVKVSSLKILDFFNYIITEEMVAKAKPSPLIYITAVKKANLKPSDCLVLEDSELGLISGAKAKCNVFFVPNKFIKDYKKIAKKYNAERFKSLNDVYNYLKNYEKRSNIRK